MSQKAFSEDIAALFQVLGNKIRMRIVLDLTTGEKCVCRIFGRLKLPQNLVSHHLGVLRKYGVIRSRRVGKWVYYSLNNDQIKHFKRAFQRILKTPKDQTKC